MDEDDFDALLDQMNDEKTHAFSSSVDWTSTGPCDPVGDFREAACSIYLQRPLTPFEAIVIRAGLANPNEFEPGLHDQEEEL